MPFTRISYMENQYHAEQLQQISRVILSALVDCCDVPVKDCFQVFHHHQPEQFIYDPHYLQGDRSDGLLYIQITLKSGRGVVKKKKLYMQLAKQLAEQVGVRIEDVFIMLIETEFEDWSFGSGLAQMVKENE
ncbi:2-hydroxymuconate tautomerase [Paenibacillus nuruki]|jgi:phenylpyruvate tautomerase PptA (4-oxalocrotonate tautomerase family)|uniref:2-hydroxymuconate tautomerase n=1 Tax=Paenibacillus nuruki TaxID=1886670 RepID=A0A1E3L5L6_9BACL|nr:tautomerase family protein [Paenibacillus nuruki]ODP29058.1 2-hydroxymuconate tautomerase [Paenibacillus nuruki]